MRAAPPNASAEERRGARLADAPRRRPRVREAGPGAALSKTGRRGAGSSPGRTLVTCVQRMEGEGGRGGVSISAASQLRSKRTPTLKPYASRQDLSLEVPPSNFPPSAHTRAVTMAPTSGTTLRPLLGSMVTTDRCKAGRGGASLVVAELRGKWRRGAHRGAAGEKEERDRKNVPRPSPPPTSPPPSPLPALTLSLSSAAAGSTLSSPTTDAKILPSLAYVPRPALSKGGGRRNERGGGGQCPVFRPTVPVFSLSPPSPPEVVRRPEHLPRRLHIGNRAEHDAWSLPPLRRFVHGGGLYADMLANGRGDQVVRWQMCEVQTRGLLSKHHGSTHFRKLNARSYTKPRR